MKLLFKKINQNPLNSFAARREYFPCLEQVWHFHVEIELILVLKGEGTRFVGDNISPFKQGELALIGENLPHLWANYSNKYQDLAANEVDVIIIQFDKNFLGDKFFDYPEMLQIRHMLEKAKSGILFSAATLTKVITPLKALPEQTNFERIITLFSVLHQLSSDTDYQLACNPGYSFNGEQVNQERLNNVYQFLLQNFKEEISLEAVAKQANLSPWAFCRYFKQHTKKTLSQFINELRIGHASNLLISNNLSVSQIGYECGFNSLTNFNRQFKRITNLVPYQYRKQFMNS